MIKSFDDKKLTVKQKAQELLMSQMQTAFNLLGGEYASSDITGMTDRELKLVEDQMDKQMA